MIDYILIKIMSKDFRRNVLTTISQLTKKILKLQQSESKSAHQTYFNNILSQVELLRSDLILILNQNFYLQCKMSEKEKIIDDLYKQYVQLQENSKLNMRMAQIRYQKLKNNIKYNLFLHTKAEKNNQIGEESDCGIQGQISENMGGNMEQFPTPTKVINFRKIKSSLENRSTVLKQRKKQWILEEEVIITEKFDAQTRVGEGAKSDQIPKFDENFRGQRSKSNELDWDTNSTKKKRGNSAVLKIGQQRENCKQEELKMLVSEQWKVPPLKQRYFCADFQ